MILRSMRFLRALGLGAVMMMGCDAGAAKKAEPPTEVQHEVPDEQSDDTTDPAEHPSDETPIGVKDDPDGPKVEPSDAVAHIDANLAKLRALELFEVGDLIMRAPDGDMSCYGLPCPDQVDAVRAATAVKLEKLAALAEEVSNDHVTACDATTIGAAADAHLATLDSLAIVDVGAFLELAPANNPMCYNLPCESDIAAADAANCNKVVRLGVLAAKAAEAFGVEDVAGPDPRTSDIGENLATLRALDVFEVGDLMTGNTIETSACYVCPFEEVVQDEVMAADRLRKLAAVAEETIGGYREQDLAAFASCDLEDGRAWVASLDALEIVDVGALIERDPAEEGLCYVGGCSEADVATAKAMACRRAQAAHDLFNNAAGL